MWVHGYARVHFMPVGMGVDVDFYPWQVAGAGAGLGFNPRVWVYMSSTRE